MAQVLTAEYAEGAENFGFLLSVFSVAFAVKYYCFRLVRVRI